MLLARLLVVAPVSSQNRPDEVNTFNPPFSLILDHIDYITKLSGVDHLGLASDFHGIDAFLLTLEGVNEFPVITNALLERSHSSKDITKIWGGNFMRVFKQNSL